MVTIKGSVNTNNGDDTVLTTCRRLFKSFTSVLSFTPDTQVWLDPLGHFGGCVDDGDQSNTRVVVWEKDKARDRKDVMALRGDWE